MDYSYALTPFITWLITGVIKFLINCIKTKAFAFSLIGYGGFPSNHSAIVSSMASLIAFKDGLFNPQFGVAITFAFITILDARSLRFQIGQHAKVINELSKFKQPYVNLRERIGHSDLEIVAGIAVGFIVAYALNLTNVLAIH